MKINGLRNKLLEFENKEFGKGASLDEIKLAQVELSVRFPDSYIAFLRQFGWGRVAHFELYGLGTDVPPYLDLVRVTCSEREEMEPRLKMYLIPIMNDGGGNHYCLDSTRLENGECPVVFWDHELGRDQVPDQVGENFVSWLSDKVDELSEG